MVDPSRTGQQSVTRKLLSRVFSTEPSALGTDVAVVAVRVALVWIFIYYGAGKLFGAFNGPGIHNTALFMSNTAHLYPGGLFAVVGGVIEFGGAIAIAFGLVSRLAGLALFGDQVIAMITVSWAHGINSLTATPGYEFNLALAAMALVIVGLGAGRLSLDAVIGRHLGGSTPTSGHEVASDAARSPDQGQVPTVRSST
jgi:putative oxidoreductase